MVRIPFIGNFEIPIVFKNEFGRYDINTGEPIAWVSPDSLRLDEDADLDYNDGATLAIRMGDEGEAEEVAGPDTTGVENVFPERDLLQVRAGAAEGGWEIVRPPAKPIMPCGRSIPTTLGDSSPGRT